MNTRILISHALSPLHAGTGQSVGAIDLAIARDPATDHPYLPGSSLKGSLRALAFASAKEADSTGWSESMAQAIFGPPADENDESRLHAGSMAFGDARLLLLPVRSVKGTFAWVTSPFLLARYRRDAVAAGLLQNPELPQMPQTETCLVAAKDLIIENTRNVIFEDLDLAAEERPEVQEWARHLGEHIYPSASGEEFWRKHLETHLCIVHDDVMTFLARYGTEVVTRNVLKAEEKVTDNLWVEENLPSETVLYSLLLATPNTGARKVCEGLVGEKMFESLESLLVGGIQLGGKATVGRGRCRMILVGGAA